jgi:hypothetical protein
MNNSVKAVVPITSQIHSDTFAQALGAKVLTEPNGDSGWAFFTGGSPTPLYKTFKDAGYRNAVFWIGSDSAAALHQVAIRKNIDTYDVHFCVHERIKKELELWGVNAHVVWPCARNYSEESTPPKQRLVCVYIPTRELYLYDECRQVASENPDIDFIFYGSMFEMENLPPNVKDAGRMKPEETANISNDSSVMLRLVRHDGMPISCIEMLQRGRNCITNYPYEGMMYARTMDDVNKLLRDGKTHEMNDGPWPAYFRERCSKESFKRNVERVINESM